ncbi:hypothetical protein [Pseudooceanicola atlanticus]|uniref:Uncharacterized protein n=1 Tax=Pseudooceanicola atlanticus TaxID=1461694 RepID=A0A0A0EHT3_9RHOB|nr:hypothetical protein [Pseudooceanicola atlanticus]KGM49693.1 hypothetical protein ATO9_06680 [Pseudooceanicola atlanticus]
MIRSAVLFLMLLAPALHAGEEDDMWDAMAATLPPAPPGYVREIAGDRSGSRATFGDDVEVEARYIGPDGTVALTLLTGNSLLAAAPSAIGLGSLLYGTEEINGQGYFAGRDSLTAQFGKLLIEAEGAERAVIREVLQGLDIARLKAMFPAE